MSGNEIYTWTDNPMEAGVAICDPDVVNENLMYLRYIHKTYPDMSDVVRQETADVLYCWENANNNTQKIYTRIPDSDMTVELIQYDVCDSNGKPQFDIADNRVYAKYKYNYNERKYYLWTSNNKEYYRDSDNDISPFRAALTDNDINILNITQSDGQWIYKRFELSTATAINTYTLSLVNYLPTDNYNYLVHVQVKGYLNTSGKSSAQYLSSDIYHIPDTINEPSGSYTRTFLNNLYIPVGAGRELTYQITGNALSDGHVIAYGYKRLGTNK